MISRHARHAIRWNTPPQPPDSGRRDVSIARVSETSSIERHPAQALAVLSLGDCAECGRGTIANQRESLRAAVAWLTAIVSDEGRPDKTTSIADPGPMTVVRHRPDCEGLHSEAPFRRLEPG